MEATILYLIGLLIGGIVTYFVVASDMQGVNSKLTFENIANFKLFMLYSLPLFCIGLSFVTFAHALRIFCRGLAPFSRIRKKLKQMKKN